MGRDLLAEGLLAAFQEMDGEMNQYSFTEEQLFQIIKLAYEIGHGSPGGVGPITYEWPQKILRYVKQVSELGKLDNLAVEFAGDHITD